MDSLPNICRMCFCTAEGMNYLPRFLQDINCSFGSGGLNAWFQSKELPEFLHQIHNLPVKKAARFVCRQPTSVIWVLSPELQISGDGKVISYPGVREGRTPGNYCVRMRVFS